MVQVLTEHKLTKILVARYQDGFQLPRSRENCLIVDSRIQFGHVQHVMTFASEKIDYLSIDVLIRDDVHPAIFSNG